MFAPGTESSLDPGGSNNNGGGLAGFLKSGGWSLLAMAHFERHKYGRPQGARTPPPGPTPQPLTQAKMLVVLALK